MFEELRVSYLLGGSKDWESFLIQPPCSDKSVERWHLGNLFGLMKLLFRDSLTASISAAEVSACMAGPLLVGNADLMVELDEADEANVFSSFVFCSSEDSLSDGTGLRTAMATARTLEMKQSPRVGGLMRIFLPESLMRPSCWVWSSVRTLSEDRVRSMPFSFS